MPFKLGPTELIIILAIVMIVFGAGKLPQIGSSVGKAAHGFRRAIAGEDQEKPGEGKESSPTTRA